MNFECWPKEPFNGHFLAIILVGRIANSDSSNFDWKWRGIISLDFTLYSKFFISNRNLKNQNWHLYRPVCLPGSVRWKALQVKLQNSSNTYDDRWVETMPTWEHQRRDLASKQSSNETLTANSIALNASRWEDSQSYWRLQTPAKRWIQAGKADRFN